MKFEEWFYYMTLLSKFKNMGLVWVFNTEKGNKEMAWVDFNETMEN